MGDILLLLLIILGIALVWRGPKTLPKLGEAFGRGVKEAKIEAAKAQAEIQARADASLASADAPDESAPAAPAAPPAPTPDAPAPTAPAAPVPTGDSDRPA